MKLHAETDIFSFNQEIKFSLKISRLGKQFAACTTTKPISN